MKDSDPNLEFNDKAEDLDSVDPPRQPALVIQVYSWATPIIGVVMLVLGLALGYFGRPLINPSLPETSATPIAQAQPDQGTPTAAEGESVTTADRQEMMNYLIAQTKHFKGDPDAKVTIIEFSDYQ